MTATRPIAASAKQTVVNRRNKCTKTCSYTLSSSARGGWRHYRRLADVLDWTDKDFTVQRYSSSSASSVRNVPEARVRQQEKAPLRRRSEKMAALADKIQDCDQFQIGAALAAFRKPKI